MKRFLSAAVAQLIVACLYVCNPVNCENVAVTWQIWRAFKKLELLSDSPRETLMLLSCPPSFITFIRTLTYETNFWLVLKPGTEEHKTPFYCIMQRTVSKICLLRPSIKNTCFSSPPALFFSAAFLFWLFFLWATFLWAKTNRRHF